ncbi:Membrane protein implicated in regulation of membrane protease activity [Lachnospiraceae bacterium NE2001]|nr:Membrane protein implicated in regulation of membrane protease activity [Lachnospiraceae bacterium NE2001]
MSYGVFWVIVAAVALVVEIITLGLSSIWFTGGGIVAAVIAFMGGPVWLQIVAFIVVSTVMLLLMRPLAKKHLAIGQEKTNTDSLIGRTEKVITTVDNNAGTGMLKLGDVEWRAVSDDGSVIPEGTLVTIQRLEGTKLYVKRELPSM